MNCAVKGCGVPIGRKRIPLCVSCRHVAKVTFTAMCGLFGTLTGIVLGIARWKGWI